MTMASAYDRREGCEYGGKESKAYSEDTKMLGRLMRAEAKGEGVQGTLMVGNVGVNRGAIAAPGLQGGPSMANGYGRLRMRFGFTALSEDVPILGIQSELLLRPVRRRLPSGL